MDELISPFLPSIGGQSPEQKHFNSQAEGQAIMTEAGQYDYDNKWRRKQQPTPVFLPGKFHGQRSLVDYSPWGCKESDTTEHACIITKVMKTSQRNSSNILSELTFPCNKSILSGLFFFLALLCGMWDLSSQTRDWTHAPWLESLKSNQWTAR